MQFSYFLQHNAQKCRHIRAACNYIHYVWVALRIVCTQLVLYHKIVNYARGVYYVTIKAT